MEVTGSRAGCANNDGLHPHLRTPCTQAGYLSAPCSSLQVQQPQRADHPSTICIRWRSQTISFFNLGPAQNPCQQTLGTFGEMPHRISSTGRKSYFLSILSHQALRNAKTDYGSRQPAAPPPKPSPSACRPYLTMPADRISSPSTVVNALRAIAHERSHGVQRNATSVDTGTKGQTAPITAEQKLQALRQRLHNLIIKADPEDTASVAESRNTAIREILLWEFGSKFRTDSQFLPMVDAIGKAFDTDPALQKQFTAWIADLRKA